MASEDTIHIRLDHGEALRAKRAILSSEMSALKIAKTIRRHRSLRIAELDLKNKIYTKMKEAKSAIRKLQALLPIPKIPRILKRKGTMEEAEEAPGIVSKPAYHPTDIESQLSEIQRRLDALQG